MALNQLLALLERPEPAALGPGPRPGRQSSPQLQQALESIFKTDDYSPQQKKLIRALVFLWHDHLDEAHALAQDVATVDGSLIHGIVHRREPDYGNAKYWFHRSGRHASYKAIAKAAATIPATADEKALLHRFVQNETWDPFAFVDCCQEEATNPSKNEKFLHQVQKAEFTAVLQHLEEHC